MHEPVFRTRNLTKVYSTGSLQVHALRGVDFEASQGEFIVLLGPSGSGKSTFDGRVLRIVAESEQVVLRAAAIVEGLSAGDRVVLHPSDRVHDGVRVAPRP